MLQVRKLGTRGVNWPTYGHTASYLARPKNLKLGSFPRNGIVRELPDFAAETRYSAISLSLLVKYELLLGIIPRWLMPQWLV